MDELKYKSKSGITLTGTMSQIISTLKMMKEDLDTSQFDGKVPRNFYLSSDKALIKISDMNTVHIKNALIKTVKICMDNLKAETPIEYLSDFYKLFDNNTIIDLVYELNKRKTWKEGDK